jgi:hypothetical protein
MAGAVARPQDVLLAYQPGRFEGEDEQAYPFEITGGAPYSELSGEPDEHYDDFSEALRGYLAAYGDGDYMGGRGLYGGRGADPSALVLGVDFEGDSASSEGGGDGDDGDGDAGDHPKDAPGLLAHVVPVSEDPEADEPLLTHAVAAPGSEESLEAHDVEAPGAPGDLGAHIVASPPPAPLAATEGEKAPAAAESGSEAPAPAAESADRPPSYDILAHSVAAAPAPPPGAAARPVGKKTPFGASWW